ncbi:AMP-binding protein [Sphingobium sp.]|uniref:AMP-binding protein n=1 Tax=Sphingobium sp. TaxID=1912891 RepID=UPI0028BE2C04|nr:AMP-binding protein [Sphingobium sp.]
MTSGLHQQATFSAQHLRAFARYPDRIAFSWDGGALSYRGALDLIGRFQAIFQASGLPAGSCVGVLSGNRAEAWCASIAALASRYMTTWLHPLGSLADQLYQLEDSGARLLIVDVDRFADRGEQLSVGASGVATTYTLGSASFGVDMLAAARDVGTQTARCFALPRDKATIFYTGGTTGRPKGVLRLHRQQSHFAAANLVNFEFPEVPVYLAVAPISHVSAGMLLPTWIRGGRVHLHNGFNPGRMIAAIGKERINFSLLVPTMIYALLDDPSLSSTDLSSLELLLYGAAPMSASRLEEGLDRIGSVFSQIYGQSECIIISTLRRADHDLARPDLLLSCGIPAVGCDVRLIGDDGQSVAAGMAGEICARAPWALERYWNQPEQTSQAVVDGWLRTGDIARCDEQGYLYIVDRKKDMIVTGGFNVFPKEVEDVLSRHPKVGSVAVVGGPDPKWGEAVIAMIVPREGHVPDPAELIEMVKAQKGAVSAPKEVRIVDRLPLTALGKIDKQAIKAALWKGQERLV